MELQEMGKIKTRITVVSWATPITKNARSVPFTVHGHRCKLWFRRGRSCDSDYRLWLNCDDRPKKPFDISVMVIIGTDIVSHRRMSFGCARAIIWKGETSKMSKVVPDFNNQNSIIIQLSFRITVHDGSRNGKKEAKKFLLSSPSTGTDLGFQSLSRDLQKLLDSEDSSTDVQLVCGDREFKAHKWLLISRSEVFAAKFRSDMLEVRSGRIEIRDTEAEHFGKFLRYLYSGKLPQLDLDSAVALYQLGDRYSVIELKMQCGLLLGQNLTPDNVSKVFHLADRHNDPDLRKRTIDYMQEQKIHAPDEALFFSK